MPTSRGSAQRTISAQLAYFCLVDATGTIVHYAVFLTMVQLLGVPVVSSAVGFVLGALVNFILNHRLTFAVQKHILRES